MLDIHYQPEPTRTTMDHVPKGFFAYPSKPPSISEIIKTALVNIGGSGLVNFKTWEECRVGGHIIIDEICTYIDEADLFCADLTHLNANVMFELGYAIASNKRIWLILDNSLVDSNTHFEQLRILTTVGYANYCNSRDIETKFYSDSPYETLHKTIFERSIKPNLIPGKSPQLLYLKGRHNTEANVRISKRVDDSKIPIIVDDPRESSVQPLTWYGVQVYSAMAVICHFANPQREGAQLHNARYALVAGMACGMKKPLLMLEEGDFFIPVDYRDVLRQYQTASQALGHLEGWLRPLEDEWRARATSVKTYASTVALATELRGLQVGEYLAENEAERLTEEYFVETSAYMDALRGSSTIFVGRKGSGKTANLLKLSHTLNEDSRNLVCVIRPIDYELQGIIQLLLRYKERDQKGYVIESLWKFLIFSEISNAAVNKIYKRPSGDIFSNERALVDIYERPNSFIKEDFTIRLERCVNQLVAIQGSLQDTGSQETFRTQISEAAHRSVLSELRVALGKALRDVNRVAILVDNLDKTWDKTANLSNMSEFLLGLISVGKRIPIDFGHNVGHRESINVSLTIFLRSDIFAQVMSIAREPDKILYTKLNWQDRQLLLRVIEERFSSSNESVPPNEIWERFFTPTVKGIPTKDYLLDRSLPRPRDLIFITKAAIATAVNRGHTKVEEDDILYAEKQYGQYALDSILVENGITVEALERVLYEFVGSKPFLTQEEVNSCILKSGVNSELLEDITEHLCALAFLGIEVGNQDFRFAEDFQDYQKLSVLKRKQSEIKGSALRYKINSPFWAFLEITA